MLWGRRWEGGSCLGTHVRIKDFKIKKKKEGWALKYWCFQTVVLEKTLESILDSREIKSFNPKRNQPWIFVGMINPEPEAPILWLPDAKSWLIRKDPDAGKYWRQEEKGRTEDKMVGWHHWLNGQEFEQALGNGRWWRTGKLGVLQSMGLQRVGHYWVTEHHGFLLFLRKK